MPDINKIPNEALYILGDAPHYRVQVINEDTGEIMYSHASRGGVICSVENLKVLKETGEIDGNQQHFFWGHPSVVVHAHLRNDDRIRKLMREDYTFGREAIAVFR